VAHAADLSKGPGDLGWLSFGMRTELNTGILFLRGGAAGALALMRAWRARMARALDRGEPTQDQMEFLRLVRSAGLSSVLKSSDVLNRWSTRRRAAHARATPPLPELLQLESSAFSSSLTRDVFCGRLAREDIADDTLDGHTAAAGAREKPRDGSADGDGSEVCLGTLPAKSFASGHSWFFQGESGVAYGGVDGGGSARWSTLREASRTQAVHLTFGFGDAADFPFGKRQRAREAGLWLADGDAYYGRGAAGSVERFVRLLGMAYTEEERGSVEAAHAEWSPQRHLLLADAQRRVLYRMLALADALNATLILPQLHCFCDRYWGLLTRCRHPHAPPSMHLPFACPQDALLDVAKWQAS
jgi:hypothetical protein